MTRRAIARPPVRGSDRERETAYTRRVRRWLSPWLSPLRIVLLYVAFGGAWILLSDRVLRTVVSDPALRDAIQTQKGVLFVAVTAIVLLFLLRRDARHRALQEEEIRAVLEGMADAVLVIGPDQRIVDINTAAVRIFAAPRRTDLLVPVSDFLHRVDARHFDGTPVGSKGSAAERGFAGETVVSYEARMRTYDGRELVVSVTSAPVRAPGAEDERLGVSVLRDVTEIARFEEARENFLATAAHEFKTPLAVVKACAQLMGKRSQGDPAAIEVITRQIDRLARMVQHLLEVSRFRLGGVELSREQFDLGTLLSEVAEDVVARRNRCSVAVERPTEAPVLADRHRMSQVITLLLENAVRFSPEGGRVEAILARGTDEVTVSVRDHGVGIAPERQAMIFERADRAHLGIARDKEGFGVGLDVTREIIARHGGRIWLESQLGSGSTFSFSLPIATNGMEMRP